LSVGFVGFGPGGVGAEVPADAGVVSGERAVITFSPRSADSGVTIFEGWQGLSICCAGRTRWR
jgi:hypothetical protein